MVSRAWEDEGRDQGDVSVMPKIISKQITRCQGRGTEQISLSQPSKGANSADALILDFQNREVTHFYCLSHRVFGTLLRNLSKLIQPL